MGIFGRISARQRLRRATQDSFLVPTFSAPLDCTPWVLGGLWPSALSPDDAETATLAGYLRTDLQRIADSANDDLRAISRSGMEYSVRREAEATVIDEARDLAVRRVESTLRQLRELRRNVPPPADMDKTQVLPAVRDRRHLDMDKTQVMPAVRDEPPVGEPTPGGVEQRPAEGVPAPGANPDRLQRLLVFVARQEPRLSWAVGERPDETTVLVTDLAHGWIPPGIAVPQGVRLLEPQRRTGRAVDLLGTTTRAVTYTPGDPARWPSEVPDVAPPGQPMELPEVEDLDWELTVATHGREGLPRLANTLVTAAASGADIVDQELDLLRVHLETTRYQVLAQYPEVDPVQLLNCMLLAAVECRVAGDPAAANYHFAWFTKLDAAPPGNRGGTMPESTG